MLAYDKAFTRLNVKRFSSLTVEEVERMFKGSAELEALILHKALKEKSVSELLRFYTLTNTPRARMLANIGREDNPELAIKVLQMYALRQTNATYLKGRKLAKYWVIRSTSGTVSYVLAKDQFAKRFRRDIRAESEALFDVLAGSEPASSVRAFADKRYIEDSIDALIERDSEEPSSVICREAKICLQDKQAFAKLFSDAELLRQSMLTREYSRVIHHIRRKDWTASTDYMSQSTAVLLWRLWERFGKD